MITPPDTLFPEEESRSPMKPQFWSLWHGCHRKSEGCLHCYVYRRDSSNGIDSNLIHKTSMFRMPVQRDRSGRYKIPSGTLMWTCFTSDFFIEEADEWREEAWAMIRERSDLDFYMVTNSIACREIGERDTRMSPSAARWKTSGGSMRGCLYSRIFPLTIRRLSANRCWKGSISGENWGNGAGS